MRTRGLVVTILIGATGAGLLAWRYLAAPPVAEVAVLTSKSAPAPAPLTAPQPVAPPDTAVPSVVATVPSHQLRPASSHPAQTEGTPVAVSGAHRELLERTAARTPRGEPTLENFHQQLEAENRDPEWALPTEDHLKQYVAQNGFDISSVECRTTLCEVQVLGRTGFGTNQWKTLVAAMRQEQWWSFSGDSSASSEENDQTVIFAVFHRR
jgi:hypothetical protein